MGDRQRETDADLITSSPDGAALLIAKGADGDRRGLALLAPGPDFFTRSGYGRVSDLVVAREAEGRGAGWAPLGAGGA